MWRQAYATFPLSSLLRHAVGRCRGRGNGARPSRSAAYDVVDRRRRRAWPGHRLLPRARARHPQRRRAGQGWLGGGNTGRNTTIIRSNYLRDESAALYEHALKLWEGLSQELNYNVMYSPRGVLMLAHTITTCRCSAATCTPTGCKASTTNG